MLNTINFAIVVILLEKYPDFLKKSRFHQNTLKNSPFPSIFSNPFQTHTKKSEKKCLRHAFIQNCTRFLVDLLVLGLSIILWVKKADKVDPLDIFSLKCWISHGSTLLLFFNHRTRLKARINWSARNLLKF